MKQTTYKWSDGTYTTLSDLRLMWDTELMDEGNDEDFLKEIETLEDYINYQRLYGELIVNEEEEITL